MLKVLSTAILVLGSANALAAGEGSLGLRCYSLPENEPLSISLFYSEFEPGVYAPSYAEVLSNMTDVSQTCVTGPNRTGNESGDLLQIVGAANECGATEGSIVFNQLNEIEGTRQSTPEGDKFQGQFVYSHSSSGDGVVTLDCNILPISK
ncbi:MAG: hypothetical protein AB7T49_10415 [Oligoflexales bacterium]